MSSKHGIKHADHLSRFVIGGLFLQFMMVAPSFMFNRDWRHWGSSSSHTLRHTDLSTGSTLLNAWIANLGQLVLSFFYLGINRQCTAMAGAAEWNKLAVSRKSLRVTCPVGEQREKYFLQLPYRWSVPLAAASGGLHWLLSQSVFIVRVDAYNREGERMDEMSKSAVGFSGMSFITLAVAFYALVGIVNLISRSKMKIRIPFAASCSLAISAACHPPPDDVDAQLRPVQWGVVEGTMFEGAKHCTLSSRPVTRPKAGERYL